MWSDGFGGLHPSKRARDQAYEAKWAELVEQHPICAEIKEWMWERPGQPQERRWARVLAVYGVNTRVREPMTIEEARQHLADALEVEPYADRPRSLREHSLAIDRGWERWPRVIEALEDLADLDEEEDEEEDEPRFGDPQAGEPEPVDETKVVPPVSLTLIDNMTTWMHERPGTPQVDRWARALAALGVGTHRYPMTADEAQAFADRGWRRWPPVAAAIRVREDALL